MRTVFSTTSPDRKPVFPTPATGCFHPRTCFVAPPNLFFSAPFPCLSNPPPARRPQAPPLPGLWSSSSGRLAVQCTVVLPTPPHRSSMVSPLLITGLNPNLSLETLLTQKLHCMNIGLQCFARAPLQPTYCGFSGSCSTSGVRQPVQ